MTDERSLAALLEARKGSGLAAYITIQQSDYHALIDLALAADAALSYDGSSGNVYHDLMTELRDSLDRLHEHLKRGGG